MAALAEITVATFEDSLLPPVGVCVCVCVCVCVFVYGGDNLKIRCSRLPCFVMAYI